MLIHRFYGSDSSSLRLTNKMNVKLFNRRPMFLDISLGTFRFRLHLTLQCKIPFQVASGCCFLTGTVKSRVTAREKSFRCPLQLLKTWVSLKTSSFT